VRTAYGTLKDWSAVAWRWLKIWEGRMAHRMRNTLSRPRLLRDARTWLTVLALCAAGGLAPGATSAQTAADSAAVRARIDAYSTVWNGHDAAAVAAFFSEGADFTMGNQPKAVGRQRIQDFWRSYFSHQEPERHLTLDVESLRFVAAGVAVVHVATTTGGRDQEGRALLSRRFRGQWVVHRQSGEWMISAMRGEPTEQDSVVLNVSPTAAEELRPTIRAFVDEYQDVLNTHDAAAVSAFYGDDADIIVRNSPITHGRQAIMAWWRAYFAEPRPYRAVFIVKDIRMITPDVALINIIATGAPLEPTVQPPPPRYARATWLVAREHQGARWLLTALWVLPSKEDNVIRRSGL
jgi:uncharacterized protein (TIGR02246 family)